MDLRVQKRTAELLYYLLTQKNEEAARIPFTPGKLLLAQEMPQSSRLERATPESQGVRSAYIQQFLEELEQDPRMHPHSVLVLRHGYVIAEKDYAPYSSELWHVTHSLCKSLTGMAIGLVIDEGLLSLDDKLVKIFADQASPITLLRQSAITVRHLLTMTSGVVYNEAASVTEEHWVRGYLESAVRGVLGESFQYNSMNTYMLSAIVCRITGRSMSDYLSEKLLEPMGIRRFYWECCPDGIEKGGWGLYMTPEDMAKLGLLMLQKGRYNGQQLLSEEWVAAASSKQVDTPVDSTPYGYGYQIWMGEEPGSFQFNGMLGQNVLVFPAKDMVVVNTAGSRELEARNGLALTMEKFFGVGYEPTAEALPEDVEANRKLRQACVCPAGRENFQRALMCRRQERQRGKALRHSGGRNLSAGLRLLCGKAYEAGEKDNKPTLLPVFMQAMQNNYAPGVRRMSFESVSGAFYVVMNTGAEEYRLRVGLEHGCKQKLRIRGEVYWISVQGEFTQNEDHILVLKLRICFLECSNERHIKIYLQPDGIQTRWSEVPGPEMILDALDVVAGAGSGLMNSLISKMDPGFFVYRLQKTLSPELYFNAVE